MRIPIGNLIGDKGEGYKIAMVCLDNSRSTIAADTTGLISACMEANLKYAHDRKAFGREIGKFQWRVASKENVTLMAQQKLPVWYNRV